MQLKHDDQKTGNTDMKKYIAFILLLQFASAMAGPYGHAFKQGHRHGHWARGPGGAWVWMVPAIVGGVVVYEAAKQQPPIIVQPQTSSLPPQNLQNCSPWTEVQNSDGTTTRTRTCEQ